MDDPDFCGAMRYTLLGNDVCSLPAGHAGACVFEEHDCSGCGTRHGTCRSCGATKGDSHDGGCRYAVLR